jgi:transposase
MKVFVEPDDIYLHTSSVDFRKSINGLLAIVELELELDASSGALFIFCNKKKTN